MLQLAREQHNGSAEAILKSFARKDLAGADLFGLDLSGANFIETNLQGANFARTTITDANLSSADLTNAAIPKETLYTAKTYRDAKLPATYWRYWTEDTKNYVLQQLEQLRSCGLKLKSQPTTKDEGSEAEALANRLKALIDETNAKYHEGFQRAFLKELHSCDNQFKHQPTLMTIIKNIGLFIITAGIGYAFAAGYNYYKNGRILFFNQTPIEERIEAIDKHIYEQAGTNERLEFDVKP